MFLIFFNWKSKSPTKSRNSRNEKELKMNDQIDKTKNKWKFKLEKYIKKKKTSIYMNQNKAGWALVNIHPYTSIQHP